MSQDIFREVGLRKGMNVSGLAKLNFVIYLLYILALSLSFCVVILLNTHLAAVWYWNNLARQRDFFLNPLGLSHRFSWEGAHRKHYLVKIKAKAGRWLDKPSVCRIPGDQSDLLLPVLPGCYSSRPPVIARCDMSRASSSSVLLNFCESQSGIKQKCLFPQRKFFSAVLPFSFNVTAAFAFTSSSSSGVFFMASWQQLSPGFLTT